MLCPAKGFEEIYAYASAWGLCAGTQVVHLFDVAPDGRSFSPNSKVSAASCCSLLPNRQGADRRVLTAAHAASHAIVCMRSALPCTNLLEGLPVHYSCHHARASGAKTTQVSTIDFKTLPAAVTGMEGCGVWRPHGGVFKQGNRAGNSA